ncbi:hypothetical protein HHL16_03955 [Pseudoflavitalea sp. G-6-1-2]|uniref:hypothetical protein n=1 Tax=Pseudoflavitalea sp. G-6-1-2 TaxID=2728841 RepID=UPI00146AEDC8|nr:hypothetical protein [Pseudoflavitalea sp. G-6-1-2]NML20012.1 hypothetical protein [Pseudoflavitalea sp. G-6-1-2]
MIDTLPIEQAFNIARVELIYRNQIKPSERPKIKEAKDAYKLFLDNWDKDKIQLVEQFKIMLLDRSNRCMAISEVATGGITWTFGVKRF